MTVLEIGKIYRSKNGRLIQIVEGNPPVSGKVDTSNGIGQWEGIYWGNSVDDKEPKLEMERYTFEGKWWSYISQFAMGGYRVLSNPEMDLLEIVDYKKIDFLGGETIQEAIKELERFKKRGQLVYVEFNGFKLYSDIDDLDSAYKKITGMTKAEFDAEAENERYKYKEEERKHREAIPELIKYWVERGNVILDEKYRETWAKCVPIRLDDLYQGMELQCCLDIVIELNNNCTLDEAKAIIEGQGHSGMSLGLVCSMVKSFCDRGAEFVAYVK
jgi:hypothetical protein